MASFPNRPTDFDPPGAHDKLNDEANPASNGVSHELPTRSLPNGTATSEVPNGDNIHNISTDILIIGGGMGGMYGMWKFRQLGLDVKLFEAGSYFGGTWHWNRYPGARVDSETPYYGLSIPEVYRTWNYSERFPGHEELRQYFTHVDKTLGLSKDAYFNTIVTEAKFDTESATWTVKTDDGGVATCKYLVLATGSSYKKHFPDFKNLSKFKGQLIHSALYPDNLDVTNKKVACIGSGATGVQIVQTLAREDCKLHAYVRTPNVALPMRQRFMTKEEQDQGRCFYESWFENAKACRSGFPYNPATCSVWDVTSEAREAYWEDLWNRGGFSFLISNYGDFLTDKKANVIFYDFWAKKVRERIKNPVKREILAPLQQKHWFGTKRPSLEQDYYERIDQDNVTVVDLNSTPIEEFTETGIKLSDRHEDYDIVILATGYDSVTGSLTDMDLIDTSGIKLKDKWAKGTFTHLGLTINGLPNMFMVYSPQAPTSLSNGPPIIEIQINWIASAIKKMRDEGIKYVDAQLSAAEKWRQDIQDVNDLTLYPETNSWYMGANVPGKVREQLLYLNGVDTYAEVTKAALENWTGFDVVKA